MTIPFDSLVMAIVCAEAQAAVGAYIRSVVQRDPQTITLRLAKRNLRIALTFCCDPEGFRMHLDSAFDKKNPLDHFGRLLREKLKGGRVLEISQNGFDRICHVRVGKSDGEYLFVAWLTGTHANLFLVSPEGRLIAKCRKVGKRKLGEEYAAPSPPASDLGEAIHRKRGLSAFLEEQIGHFGEDKVMELAKTGPRVLVVGKGAYAFPPWGESDAKRMSSLSVALEQHFSVAARERGREKRVAVLEAQLERARKSVVSAISRLKTALNDASEADTLQKQGQLLLAFGSTLDHGAKHLDVFDEKGELVRIVVDPDKSYVENAERLFRKAKRARRSLSALQASCDEKTRELLELESVISSLSHADEQRLEEIESTAKKRGWLKETTSRVSDGNSQLREKGIRSAESPSGFLVLWGETASANDHLTTRVARPNDYWLHVRGHAGAHVVIRTLNKPERVQKPDLEFAARIAVKQSAQKHAKHVPVDYTLVKHVRKPKKSDPGATVYTHEKTLFVDP